MTKTEFLFAQLRPEYVTKKTQWSGDKMRHLVQTDASPASDERSLQGLLVKTVSVTCQGLA